MAELKELKKKAQDLSPIVRIGKNGLTETMINEIKKNLKTSKLIKIKYLRTFIEGKDRKEVSQEIVDKTGATLVQQTGFTLVLYKK